MKNIKIAAGIGLIVGLVSCSEWQEPQIDSSKVEVFVPRDSLRTDIATQLFYWYDVKGAAKYELQIVTPSFDRIDRLVLDTNITGNKFEFTLQPGTYQWSVRAYNFSSTTGYTTQFIFIDSTLDLNNQKLVLLKPANRDTSNQMKKLFSWQNLYNVEHYRFEVYQPDFSGQLVYSKDTPDDTITYHLPLEGNYEWRVKGVNSGSSTVFTSRELYIDTTPPLAPILKSPAKGIFLSGINVDFEWNKAVKTGSSTHDTLYLANDSNFVSLRRKIYSVNGRATADTLSNGIYYWKVRSFDKAGNIGSFSNFRQFTKQ